MQTSKLGSQNLKSSISELQWISTFRVVYIWNFSILSSPGGVRFFAPVQTSPGAYPASCTMSTGSLSQTVNLPGHGIEHPPPSSKKKVKWSCYRPSVAQRVWRGIALEEGEWSAAHPGHTSPLGKTRYPFYRRLGGAPGPVWTGGKSRPHWDSIPHCPAHSQLLYRLSYSAHTPI